MICLRDTGTRFLRRATAFPFDPVKIRNTLKFNNLTGTNLRGQSEVNRDNVEWTFCKKAPWTPSIMLSTLAVSRSRPQAGVAVRAALSGDQHGVPASASRCPPRAPSPALCALRRSPSFPMPHRQHAELKCLSRRRRHMARQKIEAVIAVYGVGTMMHARRHATLVVVFNIGSPAKRVADYVSVP